MDKRVPEMLSALGKIYEERNILYGDNYKNFGKFMQVLFPKGLNIETDHDWNRLGIFIQMVSKLTRYGEMFSRLGHPDSLDDAAVYSQMLQELDNDIRECLEDASGSV